MRWIRAAQCAAHTLFRACLVILAGAVSAQDVTLISRDGGVEISGTLLGFDGEFYRVYTKYGELTVDGSGVNCEGPGCPNLERFVAEFRISGASTAGDVLLPALIEGFARRNLYTVTTDGQDGGPRTTYTLSDRDGSAVARITINSTNSDEGFADLLVNEADIVMTRREVRNDEAARAFEAGMGDLRKANRARILALDALVPVVAPGNPLTRITLPDLSAILSGKLRNWRDVGGPDAPITVHLRDASAGLSQVAENKLLAPVRARLRDGIERHASDRALILAVMRDPFAIGLATIASAGGTVKRLDLAGSCGFVIEASRRNAKSEDYPLTAPLFLYTPARRLPRLAREFLSYTRSAPAQMIVRRAGFIDQSPEEIPINDQGDRFSNAIAQAGDEVSLTELRRMVMTLKPMKRLTLSFRFNSGSTELDAQSRSNVYQLATALEAGKFDGRTLVFVGFSDGDGAAETNKSISLTRAQSVRKAVVAAAEAMNAERVTLGLDAFGEAMPMACDDSAWGRQVNRRVEVWVR